MELSRRAFLQSSAMATGGLLLPVGALTATVPKHPLYKKIGEIPTICTYCAVGCGQIVAVEDGRVTNIEGDPDHPINQGALCSKGMASLQVVNNPRRLNRVLYRAPNSDQWEERSWDWAIAQIGRRIKDTRDQYWTATTGDGKVVNRTEAIAFLGGAQNTNEECYLWCKAVRSLGIVYLDHQARI